MRTIGGVDRFAFSAQQIGSFKLAGEVISLRAGAALFGYSKRSASIGSIAAALRAG